MENVKINAGEYKIHSAGTVVGIPNTPISFTVFDINYEFIFQIDLEDTKSRFNYEQIDDKKAKLILINFNSNLGKGVTTPYLVGTVGSDNLYVSFIVYTIGNNSGKLFHYSWLLKENKEVENG